MELGIHVIDFTYQGGIARGLGDIAEAAEEAGCQHVSTMDHWFQMEAYRPATDPMLEAYTTLGYLAARTERIKLHALVTGVTYRHPGLLAKIVTTLDVLSGGRAELGLGAAWYEREHRGLGVPFPPAGERLGRLEEALQIVHQMWSDDDGPFEGRWYQLAETICSPRPLSTPHPRIILGGGGEKKTLRLCARYADATNLYASSTDDVAHKLDVLRRHCEAEGTDYDRLGKTILYVRGWPQGEAFLEEMRGYAVRGVDTVVVMPRPDDPARAVAALGDDLIPRLAEL